MTWILDKHLEQYAIFRVSLAVLKLAESGWFCHVLDLCLLEGIVQSCGEYLEVWKTRG